MKTNKIIEHITKSFENWIKSENLSEYRQDLDLLLEKQKMKIALSRYVLKVFYIA